MAILSVEDVGVTLNGHEILAGIDFEIESGRWIGLLGPNGSGKTTLLRAVAGTGPYDGTIRLDGRLLSAWDPAERARRLAYMRQAPTLTFDFTVRELVRLGRAPHKRWLQGYNTADQSRVQEALAHVDLDGMGDRSVLSLSGGETQRVFLAQALVQEADLLLLDEPTAHLDVHYQFAFMNQVATLVEKGRTVFAVFHDLELAARYADRLLMLKGGRVRAEGPPEHVLTPERIARVFGMEVQVWTTPEGALRIEYLEPVSDGSPPTKGAAPVSTRRLA